MDFTKYFSRKIYTTEAWKLSTKNHIVFWATKLWYAFIFIAVPIYVWGFWGWLAGFMAMNVTMGLTLSLVFQLAHVLENTEFEHIVQEKCKEFNVPYNYYETMGGAIASHFRTMRQLGKQPSAAFLQAQSATQVAA